MAVSVGEITEGKVTGITKFGCFVLLENGKSGLVHISEIANAYVSEVSEHVRVGDTVKVRVLNMTPDGRINLSIKQAAETPAAQPSRPREPRPAALKYRQTPPQAAESSGDQDFEDRLKRFMQESDSRIADNRMYSDRRQRSSRRR